MMVNLRMVKRMEEDLLHNVTDKVMMDYLRTMSWMDSESTNGMTVQNILDNGRIVRWMDMVYLFMQMEEYMKALFMMIKKVDLENFIGLMDLDMKVSGSMVNNMEGESSFLRINL